MTQQIPRQLLNPDGFFEQSFSNTVPLTKNVAESTVVGGFALSFV